MRRNSNQFGLTLIELMISMLIMLFLIAGILWFYSHSNSYNVSYLRYAKLTENIQKAMTPIINDIRRAGYWNQASTNLDSNTNTNPYMTSTNDLQVNAGGNCVLMSYDLRNIGGVSLPSLGDASGDNRFGYRLVNNKLQTRPTTALSTFSCNDSTNSWIDITNPNDVTVTNFVVSLADSKTITVDGSGTLQLRYASITITAQEADDSSISKTVTETVKVSNDKFTP